MGYGLRAGLVHSARALYALNWMDMAPALIYMKADLHLTVVDLGALVTAFYVGLASFQILGGYLASYMGDKTTSMIGLLSVAIFAIMSGISVNFTQLLISRFLAGASAALFFSPGLSLLASIVPENQYSFHIGVYNGSFNVGGAVGIIGWAVLDEYFGYRIPFIIAGVITVILFVFLTIAFRNTDNIRTEKSDIMKSLRMLLSNRTIILLALIGMAAMVAETIMGQFFLYYLEAIDYPENLAGSISSLYMLIGFLGGIFGGYHFSRTRYRIGTFLSLNIMISALFVLIGLLHYYIFIIVISVLMGIVSVYSLSITYTFVRYLTRRDLVSLALSLVNAIQLVVAVIIPILFTFVIARYNYELAWISMAILSLIFLPLMFFARDDLLRSSPAKKIQL